MWGVVSTACVVFLFLDAVGWFYVTHLLCGGVGTIVLWDGGGSCLFNGYNGG